MYEKRLAAAAAIYLDANVLFHIAINVGSSGNVIRYLYAAGKLDFFSSIVAIAEVIYNLRKKVPGKNIGDVTAYLWLVRHMVKNDFDTRKIKLAGPPDAKLKFQRLVKPVVSKHARLGAADIWHLAVALELKESKGNVVFLTTEKKLLNAARDAGLDAINPWKLDVNRLEAALKAKCRLIGA